MCYTLCPKILKYVMANVSIKENGLYLTNVFPEKRFSIIVCLQLNIKIRQRFRLLTT